MPWTTGAPVTQSWGTTAATTETYSSGVVSRVVWRQVTPQPESSDGGIDFEYQLRDTYPMLLSEDRPFLLLSSLSEGQP